MRQRRIEVIRLRDDRIDQRHRVASCLGHTKPDMRPRNEGGIADQRNTPESDVRRFEIVDRLEKRFRRAFDGFDKRRRQQALGVGVHRRDHLAANAVRRNVVFVTPAVCIGKNIGERMRRFDRAIPDKVIAAFARASIVS